MQFIIDRFEDEFAVCEGGNGSHIHILRSFLPDDAREGGVLTWAGDAWALDTETEEERRARIFAKQEGLFR